jgi:hypothetical protein
MQDKMKKSYTIPPSLPTKRATFTRTAVASIVVVLACLGCGGSSGSTSSGPKLLRSITKSIDPTVGGVIEDSVSGVRITIQASSDVMAGDQEFRVDVYDKPTGGAVPPGST